MKLTANTFLTLDGVMQAPGGEQPTPAEVERRHAIDEAERNDGGRR